MLEAGLKRRRRRGPSRLNDSLLRQTPAVLPRAQAHFYLFLLCADIYTWPAPGVASQCLAPMQFFKSGIRRLEQGVLEQLGATTSSKDASFDVDDSR